MEIVERRNQAPAAPFVVILALLGTALIGLAALTLARTGGTAPHNPPTTRVTSGAVSPDAQDRNEQILAARLGKAEATHGH